MYKHTSQVMFESKHESTREAVINVGKHVYSRISPLYKLKCQLLLPHDLKGGIIRSRLPLFSLERNVKPYKPSHRPTSTDQVRPAASAHPIPIISEVKMFRINMLEDPSSLPTRGPICDYESDHHTCIRRGEMKKRKV